MAAVKGPGRTFSIVDPAGTWVWRSGPVDAAAVQRRAVLALLPVEAAVQLRAEAAVAELPRRAEAARLPRRAEEAAVELAPCAEAAAVELSRRGEATYQRRRYPRRLVAARQEACDCREAFRGRLLRP